MDKKLKEITVEDVTLWMEKYEKLTSLGAKIVHVKHLLEKNKATILAEIEKALPEAKKLEGKTIEAFRYNQGWNHYRSALVEKVRELLR